MNLAPLHAQTRRAEVASGLNQLNADVVVVGKLELGPDLLDKLPALREARPDRLATIDGAAVDLSMTMAGLKELKLQVG